MHAHRGRRSHKQEATQGGGIWLIEVTLVLDRCEGEVINKKLPLSWTGLKEKSYIRSSSGWRNVAY